MWPLPIAVLMMVIGLAGIVAGAALTSALQFPRAEVPGPPGAMFGATGEFDGFGSNGERVYYTGVGKSGPIAIRWNPRSRFGGMMRGRGRMGRSQRSFGCVMCHGADGLGGTLGSLGTGIDVPDIRYSSLARPEGTETTGTAEPWTDEQIAGAIRDGVEPDGEKLDPLMPRWEMDAADMEDTIDYLKELSER